MYRGLVTGGHVPWSVYTNRNGVNCVGTTTLLKAIGSLVHATNWKSFILEWSDTPVRVIVRSIKGLGTPRLVRFVGFSISHQYLMVRRKHCRWKPVEHVVSYIQDSVESVSL